MDAEQQKLKLPVINFDIFTESKSKKCKRHGELLPDNIRALFCGPSNCGKTNALLALLLHPNGVRFENIYIYSKSLNQPKYKFLENLIKSIVGIEYLPFQEHDLVVSPDKARPNSIFIFDDIACEKQGNVKAFYCMGRHKNVDCFYLCQSYANAPKQRLRDNLNLIVIFQQDNTIMKHIYADHVNTDMPYQEFRDLCSKC